MQPSKGNGQRRGAPRERMTTGTAVLLSVRAGKPRGRFFVLTRTDIKKTANLLVYICEEFQECEAYKPKTKVQ